MNSNFPFRRILAVEAYLTDVSFLTRFNRQSPVRRHITLLNIRIPIYDTLSALYMHVSLIFPFTVELHLDVMSKGLCLVLVIEWQPRWTNVFKCEIHRRLVHRYTCVSNSCHRGEMVWICYKAHTCDERAHCIWDMTWSHVTKVKKIKIRLGLMDRLQTWRASQRLWSDKPRGGEVWARLSTNRPRWRDHDA